MLQLLLVVLAVSIAGVMAYNMVTMASLQTAMQEQRENMRRLDVAAQGVQGALGRLPGVDALLAPAPYLGGAYAQLPESIGGARATVAGKPFLYCPVSMTGFSSLAAPTVPVSVTLPDGSTYGVATKAGFVVESNLSVESGIFSTLRPAAFIVAAGRNATRPPSCADVRLVNGSAVVDGGTVRVVSMPQGVASLAAGTDATADLFVSAAGAPAGNGRSAGSPVSFDQALQHWMRYKPASMTFHIVDSVTADATIWNDFAASLSGYSGKVRFLGVSGRPSIAAPSTILPVNGDLYLRGVSLVGPRLVVATGGELNLSGSVLFAPGGGGNEAVNVQPGGRVEIANADVTMSGTGSLFDSAGSVRINTSQILSRDGAANWFAIVRNGGLLAVNSSSLGDAAGRPALGAILSSNAGGITSSGSTLVGAANGNCWQSDGSDPAFAYSNNGFGQYSAVRSEADYPAPPATASADDQATYQNQVVARARARQVNGSNFLCQ